MGGAAGAIERDNYGKTDRDFGRGNGNDKENQDLRVVIGQAIVAEKEILNLDPNQVRQAETQKQAADVALCPRREWSGFPMKLLNYMAAGKAVVVSAGSAKAVRDGVNGCIVRDASPDAYAGAMNESASRV